LRPVTVFPPWDQWFGKSILSLVRDRSFLGGSAEDSQAVDSWHTYCLGGKDQHEFGTGQKAHREVVSTGGNLGRHVINRWEHRSGLD